MRLILTIVLLAALATMAFGQGIISARMDGAVTDPQGAAVAGAEILVVNVDTGQPFKTATNERGEWVIPSVPNGTYRVTVTMQGFKTMTVPSVKVDAGVPQTVNVKLELGQLTETVEVNAGAEIVQTSTATVNSTLQGRQVFELPYITRNALDLLVTQPGTQTGTTNRSSFINGLPTGAINITTDGINTQDNYYRSGDGFFTLIPVRSDSIEEVTLTTSAAGADTSAQGGAQVKFVTRGGTNEYHGGAFWQHRNTALDANYYFNNINGLPRDRVILNQGGVHAGGPIKKDKLFFFDNFEIYRLPATSAATRTVLTPDAINGNFTYKDSAGGMHTVNVLSLAAANGFTGTVDPTMAQTLQTINGLTANGILRSRVNTASDYNRNDLVFQPNGMQTNDYNTMRLDYNITDKHHLSFIHTYFVNNSTPDITNSVVPIYPGTGTVLGQDNLVAGQRGNRYSGVVSLRSSFTPTITNELRGGMNRGLTLFRDQVSSPALFSQWGGYSLGSTIAGYITGVASVSGSSRRTSPVKELHDNLSWVKGSHLLSVGVDFTQINFWYQSIGNNVIPTISLGIATGDPIATGSTNIFTNTGANPNFPGASSSQLSQAKALYALLTGRVSSVGRSVALDGSTHTYGHIPQTERDRQREYGAFIQDSWRTTPRLTLNLGLRYERQGAFENLNDVYSSVSLASIYGISGIGNLFAPGTMTGVTPTFDALNAPYKTPSNWSPSVGFAYQIPKFGGLLGKLFGNHDGASVLRGGYNIATIREGIYVYQSIYGSNKGINVADSVDPGNYPQYFGAPGSVLMRNGNLPTRPYPTSPSFPMAVNPTDSLNAFDPNLKMGYVQSWNFGLQREITPNTVIEVRYTGNHGVHEWRQVDLNEVNVFENGFLNETQAALNNLAIANGMSVAQLMQTSNLKTANFGYQGLPGQVPVPILQTALGTTNDLTTATYLRMNSPGSIATSIYTNATRMGRLTAAGYPANFFVVNPAVPTGDPYLVTNWGNSNYNAMQVEVRRRMAAGLLLQGSYTWAHSIADGNTSDLVDYNEPTTFRNLRLDRDPTSFDIRQALKLNGIYELPFGPGKHFASGIGNPIAKKAIQGWEIAGVGRIQSGTPSRLTNPNTTGMNWNDTGVALYNMTANDLQNMMKINKITNSLGQGVVTYLPQDFINNTLSAFELGNFDLSTLDRSKPYIGPVLTPGQFGNSIFLYGPHQTHLDLSIVKITPFGEGMRKNVEFRAQFLDALNITNFYLANTTSINSLFGQTTSAYRDFSGSSDPGARMIEFILRVNF
jgi:hypothetical protein